MEAEKLIRDLLKKPIKETKFETPHIRGIVGGNVQQSDILFITNDKGFKYILVVVDVGTRLTDAVPLKTKTAQSVKSALEKIYSRGILEFPSFFECDDGSEFHGVTKKYLVDGGSGVRYGKAGRSRQQGLVEKRNQQIGNEIMFRQLVRELKTKKVNSQWLKDLPDIIKNLNRKFGRDETKEPEVDYPRITKRNKDLLFEGDEVRVILDKPQNLFGKKLIGNFRSADIRWSPKTYEIDRIILRPDQPPMYLVNKIAYTRGQLQLVKAKYKNADDLFKHYKSHK